MTNKTQNKFRDAKQGKRLSAMEAMMRFQQRRSETFSSSGRYDSVKIGLYALLQVAFIYSTWYMDDGSNIMDNVN